ncbi:hypothetical protein R1flu_018306 [Riccia fluitans]|uniref:MPN domain-containing protein n=1 Tax=Riccia fluitans TaxID=41844 RepID=A0ABD1ZFM4_9MARC
MGENKYELSQRAYIKIVLHALKHQYSAVNGVLIGKVSGAGSGNEDGNSKLEILDAVPLFHEQLGLLPMLELALTQVDEYLAGDKEGLVIAGYYHANERVDDYELSPLARKIGDHIARFCPQAGVLLLDNRLLGSIGKGASKKPVVQLYTKDAVRGWRVSGDILLKEPAANSILTDYISEKREQQVVDFDDHLQDISKDWLNPDLFN